MPRAFWRQTPRNCRWRFRQDHKTRVSQKLDQVSIEGELHQPGRSAFTPSSINGHNKRAECQHRLPATILHIHSFADSCRLAPPICYEMSYSSAMGGNPTLCDYWRPAKPTTGSAAEAGSIPKDSLMEAQGSFCLVAPWRDISMSRCEA